MLTNESDVKDRWKQYCSELYNYELNVDKATLDQLWSNQQHTEEPDIMESEVRAAITKLKTGKVPEIDRIESDLIKAGGDTIVKIMHKICNKIWATGRFPEQWTQSLIVTMPKKVIHLYVRTIEC